MKTVLRIFALIILTGAMLSLSGCINDRRDNSDGNEVSSQEFQREKNELRDELRALRNDIDREINKIDARLDRSAKDIKDIDVDDDRVKLEKANRNLTEQRSRVDKALEDIESSSEETWNDVKVAARNTSAEIKSAVQKMGNELEALFKDNETQE